jgi:hypothetical protein
MCRVHERVKEGGWRDLYLVVTDHDVGLYVQLPGTSATLEKPLASYPLVACRFVSFEPAPAAEPGAAVDELGAWAHRTAGDFALRLPTGAEMRFNAGSSHMEGVLYQLINERTDHAVRVLKSVSFPGFLSGQEISFSLDWITGLWLNHDTRADVRIGS